MFLEANLLCSTFCTLIRNGKCYRADDDGCVVDRFLLGGYIGIPSSSWSSISVDLPDSAQGVLCVTDMTAYSGSGMHAARNPGYPDTGTVMKVDNRTYERIGN